MACWQGRPTMYYAVISSVNKLVLGSVPERRTTMSRRLRLVACSALCRQSLLETRIGPVME